MHTDLRVQAAIGAASTIAATRAAAISTSPIATSSLIATLPLLLTYHTFWPNVQSQSVYPGPLGLVFGGPKWQGALTARRKGS